VLGLVIACNVTVLLYNESLILLASGLSNGDELLLYECVGLSPKKLPLLSDLYLEKVVKSKPQSVEMLIDDLCMIVTLWLSNRCAAETSQRNTAGTAENVINVLCKQILKTSVDCSLEIEHAFNFYITQYEASADWKKFTTKEAYIFHRAFVEVMLSSSDNENVLLRSLQYFYSHQPSYRRYKFQSLKRLFE